MRRRRNSTTPLSRFVTCGAIWLIVVSIQLAFAVPYFDGNYDQFSPYQLHLQGEQQFLVQRDILSRQTIDGDTVSSRFCAMDSNDKCHWTDYGKYLASVFVPPFVIGILSCIVCPCVLCCRFVCGIPGGKEPSKGYCCGGKAEDFEGYSKKHIWIMKFLVWGLAGSIAILMIVGFTGDSKVRTGIRGMGDTIIGAGQEIVDRVNKVGDEMLSLNYTADAGDQVTRAADDAQKIIDQANKVKKQVYKYDSYRSAALVLSLVLPLCAVGSGAVGALLNWKYLALIPVIFVFTISCIVWISSSIHLTFATVFEDICVEIDDYLGSDTNSSNPVLDVILQCSNGQAFQDLRDTVEQAQQEAVNQTCQAIEDTCSDPDVGCSYDPNNCTGDGVDTYLNFVVYDYLIGCNDAGVECPYTGSSCSSPFVCQNISRTVYECSTQCNNTELRDSCATAVDGILLYDNYTSLLLDDILPLLDCTFILDAMEDLQVYLCKDFAGGIRQISVADIIIAVLLVPTTFALFMGYKRFRSSWKEYEEKPVEMEDAKESEKRYTNRYFKHLNF